MSMAERPISRTTRRSTQGGRTRLETVCVVAVLLAVALLLVFVVLNWSTGSSRFIG